LSRRVLHERSLSRAYLHGRHKHRISSDSYREINKLINGHTISLMKRFLILSQTIALILMFVLVSCKKDVDSSPEDEPEYKPSAECICEHTNLEHIEAVQRTGTTIGNIGHYHCTNCNRNFLDANASVEADNVYQPALNYSIDPKILNRIQHLYKFVPTSESAETKAEGKKEKIKKLVPSAVSSLYDAVKKYKYKKQIEQFADSVLSALATIEECVEEINSKCDTIEMQNQEIINILTDSPYKAEVRSILNRGRFVWDYSYTYFKEVKELTESYFDGGCTAEQYYFNLNRLVNTWADNQYNSSDIYPLIKQLISDFCGSIVNNKKMTYPQVFHAYTDDYRIWDHEGYTDRRQLDLETEAVLCIGYFMACMYRENSLQVYSTKAEADTLQNRLERIDDIVINDLYNMDNAWDHYRGYHYKKDETLNRVLICKDAIIVDQDVILKELNSSNQIEYIVSDKSQVKAAMNRLNSIWNKYYKFGWDDGTTFMVEDYTHIYNIYSGGDIFDILCNKGKIVGMPSQYHEKKSVDGADRYFIIRYSSNKQEDSFSYSQHLCDEWGYKGSLATAECWWHEYHHFNYACEHTPSPKTAYISIKEMTANCQCASNYLDILYGYNDHCYYARDPKLAYIRLYDRSSKYGQKCSNWQVFLKKYTGENLDTY